VERHGTHQQRDTAHPDSIRPVAARHKLFEPVRMQIDGLPVRAHLLDLSMTGALAHAEAPPLSGARVSVEGLGLTLQAQVVWVRAKRFGLHFDIALPQAMIDALMNGGATA
jgi:hypothetical protein